MIIASYIQVAHWQLYCDDIVSYKNTLDLSQQRHNSEIEGKIVTIFNIWSDTELVTGILGCCLESLIDLVYC